MKSAPRHAALIGALSASAGSVAGVMTGEELASFGLTIDEFNEVKTSEVPDDFGGLGQGDTDKLWDDATAFEYNVAMSHSSEFAISSPGYHPFLVCSEGEGSGWQRQQRVTKLFNETPGVTVSDYYSVGNVFISTDDISCGTLRAFNDTIAKVYAFNPDAEEWMTVNPIFPAMKMAENTLEELEKWFQNYTEGTFSNSTDRGDGYVEVPIMGFQMLLCPGVQDFEGDDVPDEEIAEDITNFVRGRGGSNVKDVSFYNHRASGMDGATAVLTDRMVKWSGVVDQVANWTEPDGSNLCLDRVIKENMVYTMQDRNMEVVAKLSFLKALGYAQSVGMSQEHLETCIWYMTYGLASSPMVCALEPKTNVKTLCKDLSEDLSNCTGIGDAESTFPGEGGGGEGGGEGGSGSSSGAGVARLAWAMLLLPLLGVVSIS